MVTWPRGRSGIWSNQKRHFSRGAQITVINAKSKNKINGLDRASSEHTTLYHPHSFRQSPDHHRFLVQYSLRRSNHWMGLYHKSCWWHTNSRPSPLQHTMRLTHFGMNDSYTAHHDCPKRGHVNVPLSNLRRLCIPVHAFWIWPALPMKQGDPQVDICSIAFSWVIIGYFYSIWTKPCLPITTGRPTRFPNLQLLYPLHRRIIFCQQPTVPNLLLVSSRNHCPIPKTIWTVVDHPWFFPLSGNNLLNLTNQVYFAKLCLC